MGDASLGNDRLGNMAAKKKRSRDTIPWDTERCDNKTLSKRLHCSESVSSRVTAWLSQLPPESPSDTDLEVTRPVKGSGGKVKGDGDGSVAGVLATPSIASAAGVSRPATALENIRTEATTSTGRLVEQPEYRSKNLKENNIHLSTRHSPLPLPKYVSDVCDNMWKPRASPEPTSQETLKMELLSEMQEDGAAKVSVQDFFKQEVFPTAKVVAKDGLKVLAKSTFQHCIPNGESPNEVSRPIPDLVYGYATGLRTLFSDAQQIAGEKMDPPLGRVDSGGVLAFPFFLVQFEGYGPMSGSLWVATNECLGGSAACTEAVSRLNDQLKKYPGARLVGDMTFSVAMSQNEAQLYVTWKTEELQYHTREVAAFYIRRPEEYQNFRRYVKNIIDWGKGQRLRDIQDALDTILEEDRKFNSAQAKQRPAPSSNSGSASVKRPQVAQARSSSAVSGASSSRAQPDHNDRPAASANRPAIRTRSRPPAQASCDTRHNSLPRVRHASRTRSPPADASILPRIRNNTQ